MGVGFGVQGLAFSVVFITAQTLNLQLKLPKAMQPQDP